MGLILWSGLLALALSLLTLTACPDDVVPDDPTPVRPPIADTTPSPGKPQREIIVWLI